MNKDIQGISKQPPKENKAPNQDDKKPEEAPKKTPEQTAPVAQKVEAAPKAAPASTPILKPKKNKTKMSFPKIPVLIGAGVIVLIVAVLIVLNIFVLTPKGSIAVDGANVTNSYVQDGAQHIEAELNVDCGVMVTEFWLECQDYQVNGTFSNNDGIEFVAPNNTPNARTDGDKFTYTAEKIAVLASTGEEQVPNPITSSYTMKLKEGDKEILVYTLTIHTHFTENDLMFVNPAPAE